MWMPFVTTLRFSLRWLQSSVLASATFGGVGGPLAPDRPPVRCRGVGYAPSAALAVLSLLWPLSMPVLVLLASRAGATGDQRSAGDRSQATN